MRSILLTILFFLYYSFLSFSQGRLVMDNDPYIVIANSAFVVLDNSNTNALTQTGTGGRIISESETNRIRWNISNATGTYIIPFYDNDAVPVSTPTNEIPVTVVIGTGGTAGATNHIDFSTYDGGSDNNTFRPTGVTNMGNVTVPAANNSLQVTDRFWILDANHAVKPDVTLSFTYVDLENAAPNTLVEANLKAQRWNATTSDWDGILFLPVGSANTITNIVSAVTVPSADFYRSWTLVDFTTPLPIELLSNEVNCSENNVIVKWTTATETNNNFFTIEKSIDGTNFIAIGNVLGAGNSTSLLTYSFTDYNAYNGTSYYRLKQTDYNGNTKTFNIITSENCNTSAVNINAFNDQSGNIAIVIDSDINANYTATLFDAIGKKINSNTFDAVKGNNTFKLDASNLKSGIYFISIDNGKEKLTKKIFIF